MKKVIVTGANGFIGSSLIRKLVEKGVEVVAVDISFEPSHLPESELITKVVCSLDSAASLTDMIPEGEYDAFYHFAWRGVNGPDKADPNIQVDNINMAVNCAVAAKRSGCRKLLCAGTVAERATESLPHLQTTGGGMLYGVSKYCTRFMLETYCKNIGLDMVWMQFSNIYGPANKTGNLVSYTLSQLQKGEAATFGPAMQPYDFIFVDDLIEAVCRLGDCRNTENLYFIGSGEPRILRDYLLEIGRCFGREDLIRIGERADDGIVYSMDMFDTSALKRDIGNYITKTFSQGIKYTVENY